MCCVCAAGTVPVGVLSGSFLGDGKCLQPGRFLCTAREAQH